MFINRHSLWRVRNRVMLWLMLVLRLGLDYVYLIRFIIEQRT